MEIEPADEKVDEPVSKESEPEVESRAAPVPIETDPLGPVPFPSAE